MSRRASRTANDTAPTSLLDRLTTRVLDLPRLVRIVLVCLFAMAVTVLLIPVIDGIYIRMFYTPQTAVLPSLLEAGLGIGMFVLGWVLLVGFAGQRPAGRPAAALYFVVGIMLVLAVVVQLIAGVLSVSSAV